MFFYKFNELDKKTSFFYIFRLSKIIQNYSKLNFILLDVGKFREYFIYKIPEWH